MNVTINHNEIEKRLSNLEEIHKSNVPDNPSPTPKPTPKPEHGEPIEDNKICIAGLHNTKYCKMEACHFKESCNIYSHDNQKTETQKSLDQIKENLKLISDLEKRVYVLEKKYGKPKIKKDWKPENYKNCFGRFHDWNSDICILCSYKKTCSSTCIDNNARIRVMFKKHEFGTGTTPNVKYVDIEKENKPKCFGCENPVAECSSRCVRFEECNIKYNNRIYSSMNIVFYENADQKRIEELTKTLINSDLVQATGLKRKLI